ncbi:MAG TPA: hypothetical protein VM432_12985 [Bdellovibrionales bacterium]|nr:hypothetical protein [Bdellovibrionales bacterium]
MKKVLAVTAMAIVSMALLASEAFAGVAVVHCKAPTKGLELFVPYAVGGVNPMVGTIRLMKGQRTLLEASNENIIDYTNTGDMLAFSIADAAEKVALEAEFSQNRDRGGRQVGFIRYGGMKIGMVCQTEF